jgi:cell wall-associated NlpC family hydrolase
MRNALATTPAYRLGSRLSLVVVTGVLLLTLPPTAGATTHSTGAPTTATRREHHAGATKRHHHSTTAATADTHSHSAKHARHASARTGQHAVRHITVAHHRRDPGQLIIPQGDGAPVLSIAATYLGRPYRFGSEGDAFDCSGFVRTVFGDVGVDLPHSARAISTLGDRVARSDLEPGDLVFFRKPGQRYASHVGIYVGEDKFVHAATRGGQVQVDSLSATYYAQHYFCARRIEI